MNLAPVVQAAETMQKQQPRRLESLDQGQLGEQDGEGGQQRTCPTMPRPGGGSGLA